MKKFQKTLAIVWFLGFSFSADSVWAQKYGTANTFFVDKAITKGDHKGLANYYRNQARLQRQIAENHDKMKVAYRNAHLHYGGSENVFAEHCEDLKSLALQDAEQYEDLAKKEDDLAGK